MNGWSTMKPKSKWKVKEQAVFISKLGELLNHGYPLAEALHFLEFQESKKKAEDFTQAIADLRNGYPLHMVLTHLNFHPQLVSYIFYGEQYGDLERALKEGGRYWKKRIEDMDKVKVNGVSRILSLFCKHRFLYSSECSPSPIPVHLFHDGCRSAYSLKINVSLHVHSSGTPLLITRIAPILVCTQTILVQWIMPIKAAKDFDGNSDIREVHHIIRNLFFCKPIQWLAFRRTID